MDVLPRALADASVATVVFLNVAIEITQMVTIQQPSIANAERVQLTLTAGAIIGTWFWDLTNSCFTVDEAFAYNFGFDQR